MFLAAGCRGTGRALPSAAAQDLIPAASAELEAPLAAVCADGSVLLALEVSGARVLSLDTALRVNDTIPLTRRPTVPRGIAADRFYVYFYDENALYRFPKDDPVAAVWLNNVRVAGLASYSTGEMLVSDGDRDVIWYKTLFGDSRQFLGPTDVQQPGSMVGLPGGRFAILDRDRFLVFVNRAGIVTRRVELDPAAGFDLVTATAAGTVLLGSSSGSELLAAGERSITRYRLPGGVFPRSMTWFAGRLVVLTDGNRLVGFSLP
jgi:hypothetical protein